MAKVPPTKRSNNLTTKERKKLTITEIRYVAAPDAEARLSRAVDILLRAAAKSSTQQPEGKTRVNVRKIRRPPRRIIPSVKDDADSNSEDSRGSNESLY